MKKILLPILVMLMLGGALLQPTKSEAGSLSTRGVWISVFNYEELGLCADQSEAQFRANANTVFRRVKENGCNTVYYHVRSFDDAIYPSKIVGWSKYFLNKSSAPSYDPLSILLASAHKYGLKFHVWMNPYRVTYQKVLDPAKSTTTERISAHVSEILNHYKVDGIHFDDYFYPTNEKKYQSLSEKKKKTNVNNMVKTIYSVVKKKNKKLLFGISPAGNPEYCDRIGADVATWLSEAGYVDYIVPQIYWTNEYREDGKKTAYFSKKLEEWRQMNTLDIPMYIGLALNRGGSNLKADPGWKNSSRNIADMLKLIRQGNSEGYVLFDYNSLYRDETAKEVKNYLVTLAKFRLNVKKKTLKVGKKYKLKLYGQWPTRIKGKIKFKSMNKKIATVTKSGGVKAKKKGKVKIVAYYGSKKKTCTITVKPKKSKRAK
ncbi:MAG: family 10 glycosylhydrolase [Eubacterium sp.]|nr:family 10 glycosylhydrolase [Eubacterium sp.]